MEKIITATELKNQTAEALDASLSEPVIITRGSRSRHVLCTQEHYSQLWNAWKRSRGELHDVDDATLEKARGNA